MPPCFWAHPTHAFHPQGPRAPEAAQPGFRQSRRQKAKTCTRDTRTAALIPTACSKESQFGVPLCSFQPVYSPKLPTPEAVVPGVNQKGMTHRPVLPLQIPECVPGFCPLSQGDSSGHSGRQQDKLCRDWLRAQGGSRGPPAPKTLPPVPGKHPSYPTLPPPPKCGA